MFSRKIVPQFKILVLKCVRLISFSRFFSAFLWTKKFLSLSKSHQTVPETYPGSWVMQVNIFAHYLCVLAEWQIW